MDVARNRFANRATWWSGGVPSDLRPAVLPPPSGMLPPPPSTATAAAAAAATAAAAVARYWIRGKVVTKYTVPPILNQLYDRPAFDEVLLRKYNTTHRWASDTAQQLATWGFTSIGQYSYAYWDAAPNLTTAGDVRLPAIKSWQLSGWSERNEAPGNTTVGPVKVVYDGAVCPPGSSTLLWQGTQASRTTLSL